MKNSLNDALHDYSKHSVHAHTEKELINALGWESQKLFGTAMDNDVQDLHIMYYPLVSIASANRQVINMGRKEVASLQSNVNDLPKHINILKRFTRQ